MSRLSREKSVSRSHRDRGLIRRDRSYSAPRSVHFRVESGRSPVRGGLSYESGFTAVGRLYRCPRMPGAVGLLHTRARSASAETPESCGTATSAATTPSSPMCAAPPLTAHGSPTTTHHDHQKIPSFQQKPAPTPQRPRPPMCNPNNNHTHQAHQAPHNQTRTEGRPNSTRV